MGTSPWKAVPGERGRRGQEGTSLNREAQGDLSEAATSGQRREEVKREPCAPREQRWGRGNSQRGGPEAEMAEAWGREEQEVSGRRCEARLRTERRWPASERVSVPDCPGGPNVIAKSLNVTEGGRKAPLALLALPVKGATSQGARVASRSWTRQGLHPRPSAHTAILPQRDTFQTDLCAVSSRSMGGNLLQQPRETRFIYTWLGRDRSR